MKLEEFELSDAEFILELVNDADWIRNIGNRGINTIADAEGYIAKLQQSYRDNGFGLYRVTELASSEVVGMCGLVKRAELTEIDIGFAFIPKSRGKKYAQESSIAVLDFARTKGIKKLLGIVDPANHVSARVLEKIGMKFQKSAQVRPNEKELLIYEIEL